MSQRAMVIGALCAALFASVGPGSAPGVRAALPEPPPRLIVVPVADLSEPAALTKQELALLAEVVTGAFVAAQRESFTVEPVGEADLRVVTTVRRLFGEYRVSLTVARSDDADGEPIVSRWLRATEGMALDAELAAVARGAAEDLAYELRPVGASGLRARERLWGELEGGAGLGACLDQGEASCADTAPFLFALVRGQLRLGEHFGVGLWLSVGSYLEETTIYSEREGEPAAFVPFHPRSGRRLVVADGIALTVHTGAFVAGYTSFGRVELGLMGGLGASYHRHSGDATRVGGELPFVLNDTAVTFESLHLTALVAVRSGYRVSEDVTIGVDAALHLELAGDRCFDSETAVSACVDEDTARGNLQLGLFAAYSGF